MLTTALQKLLDQELTNAKQLAQVAGVAPSTVYRWLARESELDVCHLTALIAGLPNPKAREAIVLALLGPAGFSITPHAVELDVNGDGVVDHHDALESVCRAIEHTTDSLQQINQATSDRQLSKEELTEALSLLQAAMAQCATTQAVLLKMAAKNAKKAR